MPDKIKQNSSLEDSSFLESLPEIASPARTPEFIEDEDSESDDYFDLPDGEEEVGGYEEEEDGAVLELNRYAEEEYRSSKKKKASIADNHTEYRFRKEGEGKAAEKQFWGKRTNSEIKKKIFELTGGEIGTYLVSEFRGVDSKTKVAAFDLHVTDDDDPTEMVEDEGRQLNPQIPFSAFSHGFPQEPISDFNSGSRPTGSDPLLDLQRQMAEMQRQNFMLLQQMLQQPKRQDEDWLARMAQLAAIVGPWLATAAGAFKDLVGNQTESIRAGMELQRQAQTPQLLEYVAAGAIPLLQGATARMLQGPSQNNVPRQKQGKAANQPAAPSKPAATSKPRPLSPSELDPGMPENMRFYRAIARSWLGTNERTVAPYYWAVLSSSELPISVLAKLKSKTAAEMVGEFKHSLTLGDPINLSEHMLGQAEAWFKTYLELLNEG